MPCHANHKAGAFGWECNSAWSCRTSSIEFPNIRCVMTRRMLVSADCLVSTSQILPACSPSIQILASESRYTAHAVVQGSSSSPRRRERFSDGRIQAGPGQGTRLSHSCDDARFVLDAGSVVLQRQDRSECSGSAAAGFRHCHGD